MGGRGGSGGTYIGLDGAEGVVGGLSLAILHHRVEQGTLRESYGHLMISIA